jgi:hypothetical protein
MRGVRSGTLASTNPCESMIECVRRSSRNVKHWQNGEMCLRWTAAGMLEAERQFRRIVGYRDLAKLAVAVERETAVEPAALTVVEEPVTGPSPEVPRWSGHPRARHRARFATRSSARLESIEARPHPPLQILELPRLPFSCSG